MTDEAERRAWIRGYRAAIADLESLGKARVTDWYGSIIEDMRNDIDEIDYVGKRGAQIAKLRQRQAKEKRHRQRVKLLLD